MSDSSNDNNWKEYKLLVLNELKRNEEKNEKILNILSEISGRFGKLEKSVEIIQKTAENSHQKEEILEEKIYIMEKKCLEKHSTTSSEVKALKIRVSIIATGIATIISLVAGVVAKFLV